MYIHFKDKDKLTQAFSSTEFQLANGLNIKINETDLTAGIVLSTNTTEDLFIPKFFEYQSKKYLITYIDKKSFYLNKSIKSLTFSKDSGIQRIDDAAFSESTIEKISIPASLKELGRKWCYQSNRLLYIEVSPKNNNFIMNGKFLIERGSLNGPFDVLLFSCRNINSNALIPNEIRQIAPYAFDSCKNLKSLSFSNLSVLKTIDDFAFYKCTNLERIMPFPLTVDKIGYQSFMFSRKLKSVEFLSEEICICECSFGFCSSLILASFPNARKVKIHNKAFSNFAKGFSIMIEPGAEIIKAT